MVDVPLSEIITNLSDRIWSNLYIFIHTDRNSKEKKKTCLVFQIIEEKKKFFQRDKLNNSHFHLKCLSNPRRIHVILNQLRLEYAKYLFVNYILERHTFQYLTCRELNNDALKTPFKLYVLVWCKQSQRTQPLYEHKIKDTTF